ncbi:Solute carrier family 35 member F1 [Trichinella pseudospiralis]|uniref:Solute carrier family 35 member F1 n=1 Tax=Trichinella pseudospiralis TaxID=6337 RepID=A0A0V1IZ55_TRIPS|nr:Solute carrier family 35 member F1 [Trichinella pseudospiralis]KRZ28016.1 Solute carrier family 35 member F1 [Trichinella pseudospiralis]
MNDAVPADYDDGFDCSPCCEGSRCKHMAKSLFMGQILSICLCISAVTSQYLSDYFHFHAPTAQSFSTYFFLALVYGSILAFQSSDANLVEVFRSRGWRYFILAFIDVEATFLMVKAYSYTSLASVQLLDCFTIPVVLILSFLFLKVRYLIIHIVGVSICLMGVGSLVWGDIQIGHQLDDGSNRLLGDILCLCGATMYGISNVVQEWLLQNHSRTEYLAMIGIFGSFISGIQLAILENANLGTASWHQYEMILLLVAFAVSMFVFYSMVCVVIKRSSAIMFNLSTLTADFYAVLVSYFVFKHPFHILFVLSFILVVIGTIIYSVKQTEKRSKALPCLPIRRPPVDVQIEGQQRSKETAERNNKEKKSSRIHQDEVENYPGDYAMKICPVHGPVLVRNVRPVETSGQGRGLPTVDHHHHQQQQQNPAARSTDENFVEHF